MDLGLKGKVAFIAAASQGLGRAVADELANEGASLIVNSRSVDKLSSVCDEIRKKSDVDAFPAAGDLSNTSDVERVIDQGIAHFGQIDILVTNTGGPPTGTFENLTSEDWDAAVRG